MPEIINPGGLGHAVDPLYAWVAVHGEGDESLCGGSVTVDHKTTQLIALVSAEEVKARVMYRMAEATAKATGVKVQLVAFHPGEVLEVIEP